MSLASFSIVVILTDKILPFATIWVELESINAKYVIKSDGKGQKS